MELDAVGMDDLGRPVPGCLDLASGSANAFKEVIDTFFFGELDAEGA
jgi:hypothetical protein